MIKIVAINSVSYGSTGKIMANILHEAKETSEFEAKAFYGRWKKRTASNDLLLSEFGFATENLLSALLSKITGIHNIGSIFGTLRLIRKIKKIDPDIIHLHNLHLWVINLPILFSYLKSNNVKVIWTLHDCWAFTGQCPHFSLVGCDKWKTGCYNCPQFRDYPGTYVDRTRTMWKLKKKWFSGIRHMTIVVPSIWLEDLVSKSYLKNYPIKRINNGIDLSVFQTRNSDFKSKYSIVNKYIVLGVSHGWSIKKGIDVFIELAKRLDDKYQVIIVGTDTKTDSILPPNIISIHKTNSQKELAEIYTAADVFANPTREDNYPTVNMEALACGTPVVTFRTGGSPEMIDSDTGSIVEIDDISGMIAEIERICKNKHQYTELLEAKVRSFDMRDRYDEYIELYKSISKENRDQ